MEDATTPLATLAAYAAFVCGGAFACLLLLAGPAQAEESAPEERTPGLVSLDGVGEAVGDVTGDVGRRAGDVVRESTSPVRPLAQVTDRTARQVTETTDGVAQGVEQVTEVVADAGEQVVPPSPPPPPPPPAEPPPPADAPDVSDPDRAPVAQAGSRSGDGDHRPAGTQSRAERPTVVEAARVAPEVAHATVPAAPADLPETAPTSGSSAPPVTVDPGFGSLGLVAGCDDCAANAPASGEPLHVLGLPCQDGTTPRSVADLPHDATQGGPATVSARPDVSPD